MAASNVRIRTANSIFIALLLFVSLGCGGSSHSSVAAPQTAAVPQFGHVVLLVEENHGYSQIIGSPDMPYLNSLAAKYGLATQYFANTHPSIGNYFMMTTGQVVTNDSGFAGPVDVDNLVRELGVSGKSWKSYAERLPSVGDTGGDVYPYVKHHNPFAYFTDVLNNNAQMQSLVSTSQFSTDLANNQLPNLSFVCPNLLDDAHDGSTQAADAWLQQHMAPLIASPIFQNDGLLIILFDEAGGDDSNKGGGHVAAVIVSAKAKPGFQSTNVYQHQSTLRLILQALRVTTLPGEASTAPEMAEFFQ